VTLWRLLPRRVSSTPTEPGGALWFPRELQGAGRHDNPERYGCLYVSEAAVSSVAEALAPFRGTGVLSAAMLIRAGLPLALAELHLQADAELVDLDDPRVLLSTRLRPSEVATGSRAVTQAYAARLFEEHPRAMGLRWWSTLEANLANVTLYDRAVRGLSVVDVSPLTLDHPAVRDAAELLGLPYIPST
jgi:RES domain